MRVVQTAMRLALGGAALWFLAMVVFGVSVRVMGPKSADSRAAAVSPGLSHRAH